MLYTSPTTTTYRTTLAPDAAALRRRMERKLYQYARFGYRADTAWQQYYAAIDRHESLETVKRLGEKADTLDMLSKKAHKLADQAKAYLLAAVN